MLPSRIRGPRSKMARRSAGLEPIEDEDRKARGDKVKRRSRAHCDFVRDHDCIVPGCTARPIEVMHVRCGTGGGMGIKPSDRWTVSGCRDHHAEQHNIGEPAFEAKYGIDMKELARDFVKASPRRAELEKMP